jgi:hypothetical protein
VSAGEHEMARQVARERTARWQHEAAMRQQLADARVPAKPEHAAGRRRWRALRRLIPVPSGGS